MKKVLSFLVGVMMGGLVGATLAVLLAPMSGKDLQGDMRARGQRLQKELSAAMAARRAELERQLAALRSPRPPEA